jgi:hypothetical protein
MLMRITLPSLLQVRPRSLMEIAFSIRPMAPWSKGWIWMVCESGVDRLARDLSAVSAP